MAEHGKFRRVPEKAAKNQFKIALKHTNNAGKAALCFCVCNFARFEEMVLFETEFK